MTPSLYALVVGNNIFRRFTLRGAHCALSTTTPSDESHNESAGDSEEDTFGAGADEPLFRLPPW